MVPSISFSSAFHPKKTYRHHIEGKFINPESDIEALHPHHNQPVNQLGKIGTEPKEEMDFGKVRNEKSYFISQDELLGRCQTNKKELSVFDSKSINCTSLYSKPQLEEILNRFEDGKNIPIGSDYKVTFYSDIDRLVINHGKEFYNFTTVIFDDGSAMQISCMNEKEVAQPGTCLDIIEDVKKRTM